MSNCGCSENADKLERRTLILLLSINTLMFVAELFLGWLAQSSALIADSIDMLADAFVYGLSLYAVGKGVIHQARAASVSGYLQIILGCGVLFEVFRRLLFGSEPQSTLIIFAGALALLANMACLALISKHRQGGVHMRASWIFSKNDLIANLGIIVSGVLIALTGSRIPDLIVGTIITFIVVRGGMMILQEAKAARESIERS